jgi:hypothetical protein
MTADTILLDSLGGTEVCRGCFAERDDVAHAVDPRTGVLDLLCRDCYRELCRPGPLPPLSIAQLEETWPRLAGLHHNGQIGDGVVAAALHDLARHLAPEDAWEAFEALKDALGRVEVAEDPATVLDCELTGPDFTPETYLNHVRGRVGGAVHKLIGETS